jgi:gamma-glutamyl:cysteine ligase YbdK (ATP-grasp superfamily)
MSERKVALVSNELEFGLVDVGPKSIIEEGLLDAEYETNLRDMLEIRISLAKDIGELNRRLEEEVRKLVKMAHKFSGSVHGGSSVFADVSGLEPKWQRTTALSKTAAHGFLDILGQQITIGVKDEEFGFELYNFVREISPLLLALSASSPYKYNNGILEDTGHQSRRIVQYEKLIGYYPRFMLDTPHLNSFSEYDKHRKKITKDVKKRIETGRLDANKEELYKVRKDKAGKEYTYGSFEILEPNQIYWFVRPRPDFINYESSFVLEIRIPDMPVTVHRMQAINSFIVGLAYYMASEESGSLPNLDNNDFLGNLKRVSVAGMDSKINERTVFEIVEEFLPYAVKGLISTGFIKESKELGREIKDVIKNGNDATEIREFVGKNGKDPVKLRQYLTSLLDKK